MKEVLELEQLGYTFRLEGEAMRYEFFGDRPDPARVRPLLAALKEKRLETVQFLQARQREQPGKREMNGKDEPPLSICQQPAEVEEEWWARVSAELGMTLEEFDARCGTQCIENRV